MLALIRIPTLSIHFEIAAVLCSLPDRIYRRIAVQDTEHQTAGTCTRAVIAAIGRGTAVDVLVHTTGDESSI